MTATGLVLIPLGLFLVVQRWSVLLAALPSFALFHGAAVVNVASVGLQPGYYLAVLVIGRSILEVVLARQRIDLRILTRATPLFLLLALSIFVLWLAVVVFAGRIAVLSGTAGFDLDLIETYSFRRENLAQIAYLTINLLLVFCVAHQLAMLPSKDILHSIDVGMVIAILLSSAICLWQLVSFYGGLFYPDDFFFSNAGYARADSQSFFGYLRLNGPFNEPSALAYFFSGFVFYAWQRHRLRPSTFSLALTIVCVGILFLAFSTTGMIVLILFGAMAAGQSALRLMRVSGRFILQWRHVFSVVVIGLTVAMAAAIVAQHVAGIRAILDVALLEKQESSSYAVRSAADLMAVDILVETFGIGIGLGSHKPNSLLLTLLSNVGLVGTALFIAFVVDLIRPRPAASTYLSGETGWLDDTPLRAIALALLLVHAISNPNLNVVMLWIVFGLIIGVVTHAERAKDLTVAAPSLLFPDASSR